MPSRSGGDTGTAGTLRERGGSGPKHVGEMSVNLFKDMPGEQRTLRTRSPSPKQSFQTTARIWIPGDAKGIEEKGGDRSGKVSSVGGSNVLADRVHEIK